MRRYVARELIGAAVLVAVILIAAYLEREASSPEPWLEMRPPKRPPRWTEGRIRAEASAGIVEAEHKLHREWVRNALEDDRRRRSGEL